MLKTEYFFSILFPGKECAVSTFYKDLDDSDEISKQGS